MTEQEQAHVMALEVALVALAEALVAKEILPSGEIREKLKGTGSSLVMTSALPLTQKVGHELDRIADRFA